MRLGVIGSERWPLTRLDEVTYAISQFAKTFPNLHIVTGYLHQVDRVAEAFAKREQHIVTIIPDACKYAMWGMVDEMLVFVLGSEEDRTDLFEGVNLLRTKGDTTPYHFVYSEKKPDTTARLVRCRRRRRKGHVC